MAPPYGRLVGGPKDNLIIEAQRPYFEVLQEPPREVWLSFDRLPEVYPSYKRGVYEVRRDGGTFVRDSDGYLLYDWKGWQ